MIRVINMLGDDFSIGCKDLANKVNKDSFTPDLVIGVLTGGGYVGRIVHENLCTNTALYKEIKLQRGSTKAKKKSHVERVLRRLSYAVLNLMRIAEVEVLELKARFIKPKRYGTINFDEETAFLLRQGCKRVLIVDDCIDTGMTLKIIKDIIVERYGKTNDIRIAVITTAHRHPVISADYSLYKRLLVRFPWAFDVKI